VPFSHNARHVARVPENSVTIPGLKMLINMWEAPMSGVKFQ
jgi:hypothetical protein